MQHYDVLNADCHDLVQIVSFAAGLIAKPLPGW